MKTLNTLKNNILRSIAVLAVLFSLNSCETLELEILESPNALTPASSDIDFYLNAMQLNMASFFNGVKDEGMQLTRMSHLYGPFYENAYSTTQMSGPWNSAYSNIFTDYNNMVPRAAEKGWETHIGIAKFIKAYAMITLVDYLGDVPDLDIFNKRAIMGFNIVPTQPFGFNCLGGKLLAAICCSHDSRRMLNKKYDTEFCLFETTSLYGNIKGASMYDGMRPYLRYKGDTQSKFLLTLGEDIYFEMRDWFEDRNNGEPLIHKGASSRKLKYQTKMIGVIKSSLKEFDTKAYELFSKEIAKAGDVTTQKRFYMSEYGYSNVRDVLLGKTNDLTKAENYDRFELENIVKWWKKNATKRYNNVVADGRVRKELEVWNQDTMNKIDIIR